MNFQFHIFFLVAIGTFIISTFTLNTVKGYWQRLLWIGLISGVFLYNGVGAAYAEVPTTYLFYYFLFISALACSFVFSILTTAGLSRKAGSVMSYALADIDRRKGWNIIIWGVLFLHCVPLIYPEFRLLELLSPSPPDLSSVFLERFQGNQINVVLKIIDYIKTLMMPFFFIALYKHRHKMKKIIFVLSLLLYIQYVNKNYIGRSDLGISLLLLFFSIWIFRPNYRKHLIVIGIVLFPIAMAASYAYSIIRIGGDLHNFNFLDGVLELFHQETKFPVKVGIPIIESGEHVDLVSYLKWIVTLPIPKILTGEISGARINYEISELILNVSTGKPGWYVVLPGIVAESVYIYGRYFFWLHGVFIGFIGAFVVRLIERSPQLLFLQTHLVILFFYTLNRGGISSFLPDIINHFILFYGWIFLLIFNPIHRGMIHKSSPQIRRRYREKNYRTHLRTSLYSRR